LLESLETLGQGGYGKQVGRDMFIKAFESQNKTQGAKYRRAIDNLFLALILAAQLMTVFKSTPCVSHENTKSVPCLERHMSCLHSDGSLNQGIEARLRRNPPSVTTAVQQTVTDETIGEASSSRTESDNSDVGPEVPSRGNSEQSSGPVRYTWKRIKRNTDESPGRSQEGVAHPQQKRPHKLGLEDFHEEFGYTPYDPYLDEQIQMNAILDRRLKDETYETSVETSDFDRGRALRDSRKSSKKKIKRPKNIFLKKP
jgi:hypothetical protein